MKNNHPSSVLFVGKAQCEHTARALAFCREHFASVEAALGKWGDPFPEAVRKWEGDYLISFLSRWVLPADLLRRARCAAINFHPAPPEYPGIGCYNYALYENAKTYGVTCHHMAARVDTGPVIAVKRFPLFPSDTVDSLFARTYDYLLTLFYEIAGLLVEGKTLPVSPEQWTRKPMTRRDLQALMRISPDMSREEVARRIRATASSAMKPWIELHGFIFEWKGETHG